MEDGGFFMHFVFVFHLVHYSFILLLHRLLMLLVATVLVLGLSVYIKIVCVLCKSGFAS